MHPVRTSKEIYGALRENYATLLAGSLAYSAFMSVIPLLTLLLVVATTFGGQQFVDQALQVTGQYLTPTGQDLFTQALRGAEGRVTISAFSFLLLLWSGLRVFRTLDTAFSLFYNTTGSAGILEQLQDALLVLGLFGVAVAVSVAVGLVLTFWTFIPVGWLVGPLLLIVPLAVAFLPIFYVFPDTDVSVREVLPGVLIAAFGWAVLQGAFQLYATSAGQSQIYGTLGGVLLVLTWLYVAGFLVLLGVAVNVVLADRTVAAFAAPPSRTSVTVGK